MSELPDRSAVAESIRESVTGALDWDELESSLETDPPRSVGREVGARVGREFGAAFGRELGAVVAVDIRERKGPRAILADVKRRFLELLRSILRSADFRTGLSRLRELGTNIDADGGPVELLETIVPGEETDTSEDGQDDEESTSGDGEGGEEDTSEDDSGTEGSETGEAETNGEQADEGFVSEMSVDDLGEMREETYRELLEVMSYSDLQSVAKEVGVKANLSKDEMTDRIVEEFSERRE